MPNPLQKPAFTLSDEQPQAVRQAISEPLTVLTGDPSVGKGVTGDTFVLGTNILGTNGLCYLQEHWGKASGDFTTSAAPLKNKHRYIYYRNADADRFGDVTPDTFLPYETTVAARTGLTQASHVYFGGRQATIRVRTSLGLEIEGTPNHRVWARTKTGDDWARLDTLQTGQPVAVRYGDELWSDHPYREDHRSKFNVAANVVSTLRYSKNSMGLIVTWSHTAFFTLRLGRRQTVEILSDILQGRAVVEADGLLTLSGQQRSLFRAVQLQFLNLGVLTRFVWDGETGTLMVPAGTLDFLEATATQEATPNPRTHWDKVVSLEPSSAEVFALSVPGEESFVGNGFINHNLHYAKSSAKAYVPHS